MGHLWDSHSQWPEAKADGRTSRLPGAKIATSEVSDSRKHGGLEDFEDVPAFGVLQHAAEQCGQRVAVLYGDRSWTYEQLNHDAVRCAAVMQGMGAQPGERIGILLPNVPEYIIAANAIWRAGGVAIAISPLMVAEEVSELLRKTNCRRVVCLDLLSQVVVDPDVQLLLVSIRQHLPSLHQLGYLWARHSRTGHWTLPTSARCRWFWDEMEACTRQWQPITIRPARDPAYILPTGGTTGTPKAVTLSHTNLVANAWQQYQWAGRTFAEESMLAVLPFFHSYGMSATVMGGAMMGATLILHHRFNTNQVIELLEEHRPTVFHAVPAMLVAMNDRFRTHEPQISDLKWVISGGAPLEESVGSEFAQHTGALVVEGYGLSEASPVTHVGHLFHEANYGTIGYPIPRTVCRIVDAVDGETDVAVGEVGELIVRGPQVMLGYWNDREATASAIRDGWLHTGDLACKNADGTYQIAGRKKDLVITSGFNVYPSEVEEVLCQCAGVKEAAVVGVPCAQRGELVKAFVVMNPGVAFDEAVLDAHCEQHLSKYKRPREFEHCESELPRNFLGKVIRRELREKTPIPDMHVNGSTAELDRAETSPETVGHDSMEVN